MGAPKSVSDSTHRDFFSPRDSHDSFAQFRSTFVRIWITIIAFPRSQGVEHHGCEEESCEEEAREKSGEEEIASGTYAGRS
jgi:hypothetical protein